MFSLSVPKYSPDADRIMIDIAPSGSGCELTLTQSLSAEWAAMHEQIESGWAMILDNLGRTLREAVQR